MKPELWQRVCQAFDRADALETEQRAEFLKQLAREDAEAAAAVEILLREDGADEPTGLSEVATDLWERVAEPKLPNPAGARQWPDRAGDYRLEAELARGGMGVVLRARDLKLDRPLAVKILGEDHHGDKDFTRRFLEEARLMGKLQHPGVPPVHDLGELPDGRPFFAMKLIRGQTLAALLKTRAAPGDAGQETKAKGSTTVAAADQPAGIPHHDPRFLSIFEQVCQTVAYAHSRGVIHRDLKPANIMVGAFAEVQVMDWGLAKFVGTVSEGSAKPGMEHASSMRPVRIPGSGAETQAGTAMGTPAYMAPEQARGEVNNLDERCDVFGLGAILCELLSGQPAFAADSSVECLCLAVQGDLTAAFARLDRCDADPELIALARRCLAPEKENRPRDAAVVARELAAYQEAVRERLRHAEREQAAAQTRAVERRKRRRLALALTVLVLLFAGTAGAAGWWYSLEQTRQDAELQQEQARVEQEIRTALGQARTARDALKQELQAPGGVFALLNEPARWKGMIQEARAALRAAKTLQSRIGPHLDPELQKQLAEMETSLRRDEDEQRVALELEEVRLLASSGGGSTVPILNQGGITPKLVKDAKKTPGSDAAEQKSEARPTEVVNAYLAVFGSAHLDIERADAAALAPEVRQSAIKEQMVVCLDDLALSAWEVKRKPGRLRGDRPLEGYEDLARKALTLCRLADPDPWRDQVREPAVWASLDDLERLAGEKLDEAAPLDGVNPQMVFLLGRLLAERDAGITEDWLRAGQKRYPFDFHLNLELGRLMAVTNPSESVGFFRAALATRLENPLAHQHLGNALIVCNRFDEALMHLQRAIDLSPRYALGYANRGRLLGILGDLDAEIEDYRTALKIDPTMLWLYPHLGRVLNIKEDRDGVIKVYREAAEQDPTNPEAQWSLGLALRNGGRFAEAHDTLKASFEQGKAQFGWSDLWKKDVERCQQLMLLDKNLAAYRQGQARTLTPYERLTLAYHCQIYKQLYATAADLYADAFAANPALAESLTTDYRFQAARCAALAIGGHGDDAQRLPARAQLKLREQAISWLLAELMAADEVLSRGDPRAILALIHRFPEWQTNHRLAGIWEEEALAKLPAEEQQKWREAWSKTEQLVDRVRSASTESRWEATFGSGQREPVYGFSAQAGTTYIVELASEHFYPVLRLYQGQGSVVFETDWIDGKEISRLIFTPEENVIARVSVGSLQLHAAGNYTLTIRKFSGKKPSGMDV